MSEHQQDIVLVAGLFLAAFCGLMFGLSFVPHRWARTVVEAADVGIAWAIRAFAWAFALVGLVVSLGALCR